MSGKLIRLLRSLQRKRILVVGDYMIDHYIYGDCGRISPEAPVPVFRYRDARDVLGGAGNTAANIAAAEQSVCALTCVGDDAEAETLCRMLAAAGIDAGGILRRSGRMTTVKTRFLAQGMQQLLRVDAESPEPITDEICAELLQCLDRWIGETDLVVISDYEKGVCTPALIRGVVAAANKRGIRVIADVKDRMVDKYQGIWLLKPNLRELAGLTGCPVGGTDEEVEQAARRLRERCGSSYVLVTMSGRGMMLVGEGSLRIPCEARTVYDVTGAGDTALSFLAAALANGAEPEDAAVLSNTASGIKVSKAGTSVVTVSEVEGALLREKSRGESKIRTAEQVAVDLRGSDRRIVFTNGCFDLLHAGHVAYLREAAKLGDVLVVGVNSDESVKRLKGPERPVLASEDRMALLAALECVDYVVEFSEDTPIELIKAIRPDVLVKGGDYLPEQVVGKAEVESWGGALRLLPFLEGKSTSHMIERIRKGVVSHEGNHLRAPASECCG